MISLTINYKKALKNMEKRNKGILKRFNQTARRELKRHAKKYQTESVRHLKKNTNIRINQKTVKDKYTRLRFFNLKNPKKMQAVITYLRKGIPLIYFISGRITATKLKGIPVRARKPPYVSVYKGQKTKIKRGFIIKRKNMSGTHVLLRRSSGGKLSSPRTPSMIHLIEKTGFNLREKARRTSVYIMIKILKNKKWIVHGSKL